MHNNTDNTENIEEKQIKEVKVNKTAVKAPRRGRPKLSEEQKLINRAKREERKIALAQNAYALGKNTSEFVYKLKEKSDIDKKWSLATAKEIRFKESTFYADLLRGSDEFKKLTDLEGEFVVNFVLCNGVAIRAFNLTYPQMVDNQVEARNQVTRLMQNDNILDAIEAFWTILFADKIQRIEKGMLDSYIRKAFTNPFKYFELDGTLKEGITVEDLGDDYVIIEGIEKKLFVDRNCHWKEVVVYKFADRNKALEQLQKMLGLDITKIKILNDGISDEDKTSGVLVVPGVIKSSEDWEKEMIGDKNAIQEAIISEKDTSKQNGSDN